MVENRRDVRILLRALFSADFRRIDEAADCELGAELLTSHRYSAVVLQLTLSEGSGMFIDHVIDRHPDLLPRTIVIGDPTQPDRIERARDAGVAAVILKPFDTSDLLSVVTSVAGGKRRTVLPREGTYVQ